MFENVNSTHHSYVFAILISLSEENNNKSNLWISFATANIVKRQ